MKTIASLFAGGGGVEVGAMAAGLQPTWAVEYDPAIAEVHCANIPGDVICAKVQDVDPMRYDRPDVLHASPPCPNFSVAKAGAVETQEDTDMAEAVCRFLRVLTPPVFTLENVMGYRQSQSYQRILCTLDELGYWTHSDVLNAADFGVPQTRKRLILRAVRDGIPAPLPSPTRWIGWYAAVEDLIPTLPESRFAEWQLKRLPGEILSLISETTRREWKQVVLQADCEETEDGDFICPTCGGEYAECSCPGPTQDELEYSDDGLFARSRDCGFLVTGGSAGKDVVPFAGLSEPAPTVKGNAGTREVWRAFLVEGDAAGERPPSVLLPDNPAMTIKTPGGGRVHRAFIVEGSAAGEDNKFNLPVRSAEEPVFTMRGKQNNPRAFLVNESSSMELREAAGFAASQVASERNGQQKAWLSQGRVVKMTPRALARFMGIPDSYILPDQKSLAGKIIGNAVCPPVMQKIYEGLAGL